MHWAKTCPQKSKYSDVNVAESLSEIKDETVCDEEVNIILMTNEFEIMISELEANAIIDTVCMKTVSGEKWFLNFMKCLDDTALNKVNSFLVEKYLNLVMVEKYKAVIPATIGKAEWYIQIKTVNEKILLLLSKSSLKKADTCINTKDEKFQMLGQDINVCMSTNGHYAVEILPKNICNFDSIEHCLIFEIDDDKCKKRSKLAKLHKQFGHASNILRNLLKNAGLFFTEIPKLINVVCDNCISCKTHKKFPPRPVVRLPRATTFNHIVTVDLRSLDKNIWYFHIIEKFTRFSNAAIIKSKSHTILIKNFLQN